VPGFNDVVQEISQLELERPVLVAAFRGWNDAGDAASYAAIHLGRVWGAQRLAIIEPEEFYDFQAVRPQVELVDGITRKITWPANELWGATTAEHHPDALVLVGTEPNLRWRTFAALIVELAKRHGVELVITLGALLADVPHSRPVHITGTAVDAELIDRLGLQRSGYEGPTGIVGVLQDAFASEGLRSASLWAAVPHYLGVSPNPKAALALVDKVEELTGISVDTEELRRASVSYERRVSEVVEADDDVRAYVKMLEERADERAREEQMAESVPSGDALAAELERFLRERDKRGES
jgi:proteasome assembly chaperone (PAC2) family protein